MTNFTSRNLSHQLKSELLNLPGEAAHIDMVPFRMKTSEALKKPIDYRLSAVLLLLYYQNNTPHFILTERQDYNGKHSGQISLPGGKVEDFDPSTKDTALREANEEIGVDQKAVEILGQLTEVYIPVSNFLIHPYVGFLDAVPQISPDPREVKSVLHCPVSDLLNDQRRILTKIQVDQGRWLKDVPAFNLEDKTVWGATAIILNEFKFILKRF